MQKLMIDSQRHLILIRDRVTKVRLAQTLFEDLMRPRPQVAIEVEITTTERTASLSFGMPLQTAFPIVSMIQSPTLAALARTVTRSSFWSIGITNASLFASVAKSSSSTLLNSEVVAVDGLPSTLHVGDKFPIATNGYFGTTTGTGQVFAPPPTLNYEDLGLVLKVTPHVHGVHEVSFNIDPEFKLLDAGQLDEIPILSAPTSQSYIPVP